MGPDCNKRFSPRPQKTKRFFQNYCHVHRGFGITPGFHQVSENPKVEKLPELYLNIHQVLEISPGFHQVFPGFSPGFHQVFTRFSPGFHKVSPHQVSTKLKVARRQLVSEEAFFPFHVIAKNVRSVLSVLPKAQTASVEPNIGGPLESSP